MTKLSEMRKLTKIIQDHYDEQAGDPVIQGFKDESFKDEDKDYADSIFQIDKSDAINQFAAANGKDLTYASYVCDDALSEDFGYIKYYNKNLPHQDLTLKVTTKGRQLTRRGGTFKEWTNHNNNRNTLVLSFITGVAIGGAAVLVTVFVR